jgi:putative hydrolase of HD superfamily
MNFKEFFARQRNLDKIIRFSSKLRMKDESVAEHSFHAAFYAMMLADIEKKLGNKVDVEKVLRLTLIHDLEECMTGDILFDFKKSDRTLTEQIEKMAFQYLKNLLDNLPDHLSKDYEKIWVESRENKGIEGKIAQAADSMEALMYSIEESSIGNKNFEEVVNGTVKRLKSINLKSVELFLEQLMGEKIG